jgi:hypothetical protein
MGSMRLGALATMVAALAMLVAGAGALHAQESNDEGRMRAQSDDSGDHWRRRGLVPGVRIARVEDGGTFITLRDSTQWEVHLPDRTSTVGWHEGDFVIVKLAPLGQHIDQRAYTYQLINGRAESAAVVRFRGKS